MKRYHRLGIILSIGAFILMVTGCPGGQSAGKSAGSKTQVNVWTIWNTEPRKSALSYIVNDFELTHPHIDISVKYIQSDDYRTKLQEAIERSRAPDIYFVWAGEKMLHGVVRREQTADLTETLDAKDRKWRKRLIPASLDRFTFDGHVHGIPYLLECTFFLYNKQMFQVHGWEVPETFDELMSLCQRIKDAGIGPIALGNTPERPAHYFPFVLTQRLMGKQASEHQYDPLGPGDYSDPAFTSPLSMFHEMARKGFFNRSPNDTTPETARALFYSGQAAMFYTGTWDFALFSEGGQAPEPFRDKWSFFNFPAVEGGDGDQQALAGSPVGYAVHTDSSVKNEAIEFLKYMTQKDVARGFVKETQKLVPVKGAVTQDNAGPRLQKYARIVENAQTITPWMDIMMERTVAEEYMNGVRRLLAAETTPEKIMQRVRNRQALVKKRMLTGRTVGEPLPD